MNSEFDYRNTFVDYKHPNRPTWHEMVSLSHIGGRLKALTMSPWPLKMGKVTKSLAYLHKRDCLLHARASLDYNPAKIDIFKCCACPSWRKYLRAGLKGKDIATELDSQEAA